MLNSSLMASPPARGRGLKLPTEAGTVVTSASSPPARGRGLKRNKTCHYSSPYWVAPRAGAWIETRKRLIEWGERWSPPARGRGLKLYLHEHMEDTASVAPRAGAWIETGRTAHAVRRAHGRPPGRAWGQIFILDLKHLLQYGEGMGSVIPQFSVRPAFDLRV